MSQKKRLLKIGFAFLALSLLFFAPRASAQSGKRVWNFDQDAAGKPPASFTSALTGQGSTGAWVVTADPSAPSRPNVLAQTTQDKTDYRFPLAIAESTSYKDLALSVKFKTISGTVDQGAGLVFRLRDKDNYYIVRANALENNFRLYHVVNGRRIQFAGANFTVTPHAWHEIRVEARGDQFQCYYDGQLKITAKDSTFKEAGKVGLWTKADSVIYFDDLTVEDLATSAGASPRAATLAQKLVDDLARKHPDLVRIGLHVTPPRSAENIIVASNVPAKIGQKSDPEDLQAMKTGRPVALREGQNFDVTLPLHDAAGKTIGAIGLTFKPANNEQEGSAVRRAQAIAGELEKRIPSRESLFTPQG
jgi:hypothetical protein